MHKPGHFSNTPFKMRGNHFLGQVLHCILVCNSIQTRYSSVDVGKALQLNSRGVSLRKNEDSKLHITTNYKTCLTFLFKLFIVFSILTIHFNQQYKMTILYKYISYSTKQKKSYMSTMIYTSSALFVGIQI